VLQFGEDNRQTGEAAAPGRSTGATEHESKMEGTDGVSLTPGAANRTAFRLSFRALLRPRIRTSRSETLASKRTRTRTLALGSFEDLEREISRSRRFGHSFFLARFPSARPGGEADGWHEPTLALLASLIRTVDRVWSDGRDVYLLLPESDRAMGTAALARLREPLSRALSHEELDQVTFVVFAPDECPTSGALVAALHGRVRDTKTQMPAAREKAATPLVDPKGAEG
jgi:hypothetical protein